jgi:hypothetical protein
LKTELLWNVADIVTGPEVLIDHPPIEELPPLLNAEALNVLLKVVTEETFQDPIF